MRLLPMTVRGPAHPTRRHARRVSRLVVLLLFIPLAASSATAQQPSNPASKPVATPAAEPVDLAHLPAPLENIASNIRQLENNGILRVEDVRFLPAGSVYGSDNSVVWTLRTRRHVTCRHLELLLQLFVDVRIYEVTDYGTSLLYQTLLVYPDRIHSGAIDGRILAPGEYLDVWIELSDTKIRMLRGLRANRLIAGPPPGKVSGKVPGKIE